VATNNTLPWITRPSLNPNPFLRQEFPIQSFPLVHYPVQAVVGLDVLAGGFPTRRRSSGSSRSF